MHPTLTAKDMVTHPLTTLVYFLAMVFVLPQYGGVAMMLGSAGGLSALLAAKPESFRDRNGSLATANWLVIALWIAAGVITALTLLGEIQN